MRTQWIDQHLILDRIFQLWQSIGNEHPWQQDAFMLIICLTISILIYLSGTVLALFLQSLWSVLLHKSDTLSEGNK